MDKSKVFHLESDDAYQEKALIYMKKTDAYEEMKNEKCLLAYNLSTIVQLLDKLLKRKAISQIQYSMMKPKKGKVELGHLYFLPKPHKVRSYTHLCLTRHGFENIFFVDLFIGWYTINTFDAMGSTGATHHIPLSFPFFLGRRLHVMCHLLCLAIV
jgi:hypothetical protein